MIAELIQELKKEKKVYIQAHNFPDHDAVAAAFGLQTLLAHFQIESQIIYDGAIERYSLIQTIESLKIDMSGHKKINLTFNDKIIIVDGCKGNKNVSELDGEEIAVIDHHLVKHPENVCFVDIRPDYGSCSTIIYSYFKELNIPIPKNTATAFLIGIKTDTASFTRGVHPKDLEAFSEIYYLADKELANFILRNYIEMQDLDFYHYAVENFKTYRKFFFLFFPQGCSTNLMGILGDFFLSLKEINFVVICAKNQTKINLSLRSEKTEWNASAVIQKILAGIGFGGGHCEMAGGIIEKIENFNPDILFEEVKKMLYTDYSAEKSDGK